MISHLFDINTVIALIGRKSDALISRVLQSPQGSIGLSSVVFNRIENLQVEDWSRRALVAVEARMRLPIENGIEESSFLKLD